MILIPYLQSSSYITKLMLEYTFVHCYDIYIFIKDKLNPYMPPLYQKPLSENDFMDLCPTN